MIQSIFGTAAKRARAPTRCRRRLSAWARGDHTAGPRLRLSSLNWMPVASIALPINPPSASISRTRCPFAVPPIGGIAGHVRNGAIRQRADRNGTAQTRGRPRRLDAGMSGADHDHVVQRHRHWSHFPMQNRSNIACSVSSALRWPVISSSIVACLVDVRGNELLGRTDGRRRLGARPAQRAREPADRRDGCS